MRVNTVNATTTDNYATWQANVPLALGANNLVVETVDSNSNINPAADQVLVTRSGLLLRKPEKLTVDSDNGRAFVVDTVLEAIVEIDLATGIRTILSDRTTPNSENRLAYIQNGIALDLDNNRVLVIDHSGPGISGAIRAIDLDTGERSTISDNSTPNEINPFVSSDSIIAVDPANKRALVARKGNSGTGGGAPVSGSFLLSVNLDPLHPTLALGERTIFSSNTMPDADNPFSEYSIVDISIDAVNNRALTIDYNTLTYDHEMLAIDLETGVRSVVSNNSTPNPDFPFIRPRALAVDSANQQALVADADSLTNSYTPIIRSVNLDALAVGERTIISDPTTPDSFYPIQRAVGIAIDSPNNRAVINDTTQFLSMNLVSGSRSVFFNDITPASNSDVTAANTHSIVIDENSNRGLLMQSNQLVSLDLDNGVRSTISSNTVPDGVVLLGSTSGLAIDPAGNRAITVTGLYTAPKLIEINLDTGARSILSDNTTPNADVPFVIGNGQIYIAYDTVKLQAFLLDRFANTIIVVNLDPLHPTLAVGSRTILSNNSIPGPENPLSSPSGITFDSDNNRLLITNDNDQVLSVDCTTGARSILSDDNTPDSRLRFVSASRITISSDGKTAYVLNYTSSGGKFEYTVIAVNLDPGHPSLVVGERSLITHSVIDGANRMLEIGLDGLAYDSINDRLLIAEKSLGAVISVDITTGKKVVLAR